MSVNTNRIIIETIIRRAIRGVRESPRRNTRNLVDMAYQFAVGRFQRHFFEVAQNVLSDENSAFFDLVYDAVMHVDSERLVTFGLNVGYNGLTRGAETIRRIENEKKYNVPWIVTLSPDSSSFPGQQEDYRRIIQEGRDMGIYSWILRVSGDPQRVLPLTAAFDDCAFFLQIEQTASHTALSDRLSPDFLAELASGYHNVMLVLPFDRVTADQEADLFRNLREYQLLYSVCCNYTPEDLPEIYDGDYFFSAEQVHPVFAVLNAAPTCGIELQQEVFSFLSRSLKNCPWRVIPWELTCDNQAIDGVVSNGPCTVTFNRDGYLEGQDGEALPAHRLFDEGLENILMTCFRKEGFV